MKRFDTAAHIAPVLNEIKALYTPEYGGTVLKALDCVVVLNKRHTRDAIAVRTPDKGSFNYYSGNAIKALFKDLAAWKRAAETYQGELDAWSYQEERRIMEAIRTALIKEYAKPV